MADDQKPLSHGKRVRNESVSLYDMGADEVLETQGFVVLDSSLGLIKPSPTTRSASRKGEKTQ